MTHHQQHEHEAWILSKMPAGLAPHLQRMRADQLAKAVTLVESLFPLALSNPLWRRHTAEARRMLEDVDGYGRQARETLKAMRVRAEELQTGRECGQIALQESGQRLPLRVLHTRAGFYIGTHDDEGPVSRESEEYFPKFKLANLALQDGSWTQRQGLGTM